MAVRTKLEELEKSGKSVKYLVINGRGEPTLDSGLSKTIQLLREFGLKIAVFTNSSLIWDNNVQQNLMCADYVSLKLDTVIEDTWYKINRPPRRLDFNAILNGIKEFSEKYQGHLSTATTFIKDMNDNQFEINALADFLKEVKCESSCFMTPRYPASDKNAESPDEEKLQQLQSLLKERIINPLLLCCPENEVFDVTGDFEDEFLGLLSIHPIQVSAVRNYIRSDEDLEKLKNLIEENFIKEIIQDDKKYYAIEDKKRTVSMRMQI